MTNSVLQLDPSVNVKQMEGHLTDPYLSKYDLELPSKIHWSGTVGQSASIAQFIATWAKQCESPNLKLAASQNDSHVLKGIVYRLFGLSGVYFSDRVFCEESSQDIRYQMLVHAADRFIAMWEKNLLDVAKGRKIELISVIGAKREFLPALYSKPPTKEDLLDREMHGKLIVKPYEMSALFNRCLEVTNLPKLGKSLIHASNVTDLVGELLYEAFRNTAEHAYLDSEGKMPHKGLRCVLIDIVRIDKSRVRKILPLRRTVSSSVEYFQRITSIGAESKRKNIDFIEISILDSGPGFASTMRNSPTDLDEVELVKRCFEKHRTRKGGDFSGLGLFRILSAVNELNGFIRIRTSSCEASYFASNSNDNESVLKPQVSGNLAQVVGTLLTISFPVVY